MIRCALLLAFALVVGHVAWHSFVGPALVPEYPVGGDVLALSGTQPQDRCLYLRREFYLTRRPRRAWVQGVGRDRLRLYINGRFLAGQSMPGSAVAVLADP